MTRVSIIVHGKVYKFGKKQLPAAASRVAERTRAWADGTVVLGSNPVLVYEFFFFPHFRKISKFFGGLCCRYSKRKISGTGAGTVDTAFSKLKLFFWYA